MSHKKTYDKRVKMLKHPKSKVVILDTPEAELMYELVQRTDKIFSQIRYEKSLPMEEQLDIMGAFKQTIIKNSDVLNMIADEADVERWETLLLERLRLELNQ